jgi:alpha-beta hydrolase superfamily lysophospholipase
MPTFAPSTLPSPTGATLRLYSRAPAGWPRAVVQINHGLAEHAARYERFAVFLASRGYAAYAHDHRGHGATTADDATQGVFAKADGWNKVFADVGAVNAEIRERFPGAPVVCFGHSMGAIVALSYLLSHPETVAAAAIWNTSFDTGPLYQLGKSLLLGERMLKGSDAVSSLAPKLTFQTYNKAFAPNRTEFDWLSRDTVEVDKYVADPLCGFDCSVGLWLDVLAGIASTHDAGRIAKLRKDLPMLFFAGGADPVSNRGKAIERLAVRLRSAGMRDVSLKIWPDTRHEGLNDINRDEIMAAFADWLDARFAKS